MLSLSPFFWFVEDERVRHCRDGDANTSPYTPIFILCYYAIQYSGWNYMDTLKFINMVSASEHHHHLIHRKAPVVALSALHWNSDWYWAQAESFATSLCNLAPHYLWSQVTEWCRLKLLGFRKTPQTDDSSAVGKWYFGVPQCLCGCEDVLCLLDQWQCNSVSHSCVFYKTFKGSHRRDVTHLCVNSSGRVWSGITAGRNVPGFQRKTLHFSLGPTSTSPTEILGTF